MDPATAARPRLEAMEKRANSLCETATLRRRRCSGGTTRQQRKGPWGAEQQPGARQSPIERRTQIARPCNCCGTSAGLICRTAVYATRTYGGVGGEESRGSPLSRFPETLVMKSMGRGVLDTRFRGYDGGR